jgi:diguanylate cyclase (GGDEF)-like protein/PAS domain S-box-containing protein
MPLSVAVKDARDRCYVLFNRTAEAIFGIARSDLIGRRARHASDKETGADLFPLAGEALSTRELQTIDEHVVHTHHNGTRVLTTKNLSISDETGEPRYLLSLSEDITERKQAEALIQHLAHYDALTDLPNRAAFVEHLTRTIDAAAASNESFAVLSIDLDRFKEVNDIFGHAVGDDLLRELSQQLRALAVDAGANLARLGGDEFTRSRRTAIIRHWRKSLRGDSMPRRRDRVGTKRPASARRHQHRRRDLSGRRHRRNHAAQQCRCRAHPRQGCRSRQDALL